MPNRPEHRFPEPDAQRVCWLRALEEIDSEGRLVPLELRRRAASEAPPADGDSLNQWLVRRARQILEASGTELSAQTGFLDWLRPAKGWAVPALLIALLIGASSNALGPSRQVNVLALPLFGLIAWNIFVLVFGVLLRRLPVAGIGRLPESFAATFQTLTSRWMQKLPLPPRGGEGEEPQRLWREALSRFARRWLPLQLPLVISRTRRLLHLSALGLVAGAVAGMYLRGVGLAYRPTWESTFLDAAQVDRLLAFVLRPASAVLGQPVPSVATIGGSDGPLANSWIHLWAMTALLFVIMPRLLLVAAESFDLLRRSQRLPIELPGSYLRQISGSAGGGAVIELLPYSHQPTTRALEVLETLLWDHAGPRANVRSHAVLDYGDELPLLDDAAALRVVLFSLAQTPEAEVHGELLRELQAVSDDGRQLLMIVDGATYRQRLGKAAGAEQRLDQRRRAWDRVAGESGVTALHLNLDEATGAPKVEALRQSLWPAAG